METLHTHVTVLLASQAITVHKILMNVSLYQLQLVNLPASMMATVSTFSLADLSVAVHLGTVVGGVKLTLLHVIPIHVKMVEPVNRMGWSSRATVHLATLGPTAQQISSSAHQQPA